MPDAFVCPICRRASSNAGDKRERYCGVHGFVDDVLRDPALRKDIAAHRDVSHLCMPDDPQRSDVYRVVTFDGKARLQMRWLARSQHWLDWEGNLYTPVQMVLLGFQCEAQAAPRQLAQTDSV